jgi:enoyl-CoA hydratase/carnithine racemase
MTDAPKHFNLSVEGGIARVSLNRPERKNPLTFESYAELRDWFRDLVYRDDILAVVFLPNGGNFSSGGDVHDIIGPLTKMSMKELLAFTRMTGDLVKAIVNCGKPVIAAIDGVCVGAGGDHRHGFRPALCHAGRQNGVPIHPRRPCRL